MRLIDADALIEKGYWHGNRPDIGNLYPDGVDAVDTVDIEDAPTIDPESLRATGEWINLTECANEGVYCSVCRKKVYKTDYAWAVKKNKVRSNYCPNCGAKMKEAT